MIQTFFFISSNFNYFVKSKVAQNLLLLIIWNFIFVVFFLANLEPFYWLILSDFWRVYYIYLNYLLMDSECYQKSSYLYSRLHVRDDYVYLRDNNDYCLDFDNIRNRIIWNFVIFVLNNDRYFMNMILYRLKAVMFTFSLMEVILNFHVNVHRWLLAFQNTHKKKAFFICLHKYNEFWIIPTYILLWLE